MNQRNGFYGEEFDIEYMGGKCALWGFPYSSTPILFDDIAVSPTNRELSSKKKKL